MELIVNFKNRIMSTEKRIVTQEDLDTNPELSGQGVKVGDEIEIPNKEASAEEVKP